MKTDQNNMWPFSVLFSGLLIRKLCFLSFLFLSVNGVALDDGTWTYELNGDGVTVTGCGPAVDWWDCDNLIIPDSIGGLSVTKIGKAAFWGLGMSSVVIPDSVTSIDEQAFGGNYFSSISLPESLKNIGALAFYDNRLNNVTIGSNVTNIGDHAFQYNSLSKIYFQGDRPQFSSEAAFWGQFISPDIDIPITPSIYFCYGLGWPGASINGVSPEVNAQCDDDDDGVVDSLDAFPQNSDESIDTDSDGIGNNEDTDDDNDGMPDTYEASNGLNKLDSQDMLSDADNDGLTALQEYQLKTSPNANDTDMDSLPDGWEVVNNRDPLTPDYQISLSSFSGCILDDAGVSCWGGDYGEVPALSNPKMLSGRGGVFCAIDDFGVSCWGATVPEVPLLINPFKVSVGGQRVCALDDTGVVCWGDNRFDLSNVPVLSNPIDISMSGNRACAIDDTGLVCWGYNGMGILDTAGWPIFANPLEVALSSDSICVRDDTNDVICWGYAYGDHIQYPDVVDPLLLSGGYQHMCGLGSEGVRCWGRNDYGVLDVPPLSNPTALSSGYDSSCAIDDTGVVCWGRDDSGQLNPPDIYIDPDEDGVAGISDAFPLDASETTDTDLDGIGNNRDTDDDNDGISDAEELADGTDLLSALSCRSGCLSFDIDRNGRADMLTDGVLFLRYTLGFFWNEDLIKGAVAADASLTTSAEIEESLGEVARFIGDVDGNGVVDGLTDGILLVRYLAGFTGDSLIDSAVGENSTRVSSEAIKGYLDSLMPGE